jgi:hypothetical protein
MDPTHQIELLSMRDLDRLIGIARRLFKEAQEPTLKMLYAAALRGLREEVKIRAAEHRDFRSVDWEEHYRHLLKPTNTPIYEHLRNS